MNKPCECVSKSMRLVPFLKSLHIILGVRNGQWNNSIVASKSLTIWLASTKNGAISDRLNALYANPSKWPAAKIMSAQECSKYTVTFIFNSV